MRDCFVGRMLNGNATVDVCSRHSEQKNPDLLMSAKSGTHRLPYSRHDELAGCHVQSET